MISFRVESLHVVHIFFMRDQFNVNSKTQRDRILAALRDARGPVPAPELHKIALQSNTRVLELRRAGFVIQNRMTRQKNGAIYSTYQLLSEPTPKAAPIAEPVHAPLFPDLAPQRWVAPEEDFSRRGRR
jgi:hypothetical protein